MALKINDENAKELIASGKPVVIDFGRNGAALVVRSHLR